MPGQRERPYLNRMGTGSYPEQEPLPNATRPNVNDGRGDSEAVRRYRQFFETHNLHGLPQRQKQRLH